MLFMVVCAIPSAWVGSKLEATRREQLVVAETESFAPHSMPSGNDKGPSNRFRTETLG